MLWLLLACTQPSPEAVDSGEAPPRYEWGLPDGVSPPDVPRDNPMSAEKVALGRVLFYETRLSLGERRSCGICHEQAKGFTDGFPRSVGATDDFHRHNSLPIVNVGYREHLGWASPAVQTLEEQLLEPLLGDDPIEMGATLADIEALINTDPGLVERFEATFPDEAPWEVDHLAKAIAAFERTVISVDSPWDRYERGDETAVDASAIRGAELFYGAGQCFRCHSGLSYDQPADAAGRVLGPPGYHNIGLYDLDGEGAYPPGSEGLLRQTGDPADMGRFRTPTLRGLRWTEPYLHDGTAPTLAFVLEIHNRGGRETRGGPYVGDGRESPLVDPLITPLGLDAAQLADLESFLLALSEPALVTDARFGAPVDGTD